MLAADIEASLVGAIPVSGIANVITSSSISHLVSNDGNWVVEECNICSEVIDSVDLRSGLRVVSPDKVGSNAVGFVSDANCLNGYVKEKLASVDVEGLSSDMIVLQSGMNGYVNLQSDFAPTKLPETCEFTVSNGSTSGCVTADNNV